MEKKLVVYAGLALFIYAGVAARMFLTAKSLPGEILQNYSPKKKNNIGEWR